MTDSPSTSSAADRRPGVPQVVAAALGCAAIALVAVAGTARPWLPAHEHLPWLLGLLLLASAAAEVAYVRVPHGEETEDLTLFEAVVVIDVLLLSPLAAVVVSLAGLAIASAVMRRSLVKSLFNLGSYGTSAAVLVAVVHLVSGHVGSFTPREVAALLLGTLAFAAVNLVALSVVLYAAGGDAPLATLRAEWRLSAFMAIGNVGVGALAVSVAQHSPYLLPFTALPVLALRHAYRSVAESAEQRARSASLATLGSALLEAESTGHALERATSVLRATFRADGVVVEVPGESTIVDGDVSTRAVEVTLLVGEESGALRLHGAAVSADDPLLVAVAETVAAAVRSQRAHDELRAESAKVQAVVDSATDGIVVLEGDGRVGLWSPAAQVLTGRSRAEVESAQTTGDPLGALVNLVGLELAQPAGLSPAEPQAVINATVVRADGERREVRLAVTATYDESAALERLVVITHDVTRDRRLDRMKDDFVATVSHELRTPLTPIKGYARLLATQGEKMPADRRAHALRLIGERADHLTRLVDDLLLASKVGSTDPGALPLDLGEHDVAGVLGAAVDAVDGLTGRLTVDLSSEPTLARCDRVRLSQCLINLLSNAVKYSPAGTPIRARVTPVGDVVAVEVADQGHGIPEDELDAVFERFHRVEDSLVAETGGSGLGLFIARELARAMGGDITLSSQLGVGSTFRVTVPAVTAAPAVAVLASSIS